MSETGVEFVRLFVAAGPDDLAAALRDENEVQRLRDLLEPAVQPDFETVLVGPEYDPLRIGPYFGVDGLIEAWRGWFDPWAEFRMDVEDVIDAGDKVVVFGLQRGRMDPGGPEVTAESAIVFTVEDDRVARMEFFYDRPSALKSAGLDPAAGR
jgi:ketosteroid isomerase-like protein